MSPSREDDLRDSMARFSGLGERASTGTDPATRLVARQSMDLASRARSDLDDLLSRRLDLHLQPTEPSTHAVTTAVLGRLLTQFQSALNYITWSLRAGPGVKGNLPASVRRSASTDVLALAPGSLDVVMRRTEVEIAEEFDRSVDCVLSLAEAADSVLLEDEGADVIGLVGPESASRLRRLFRGLAEAQVDVHFDWRGEKARSVWLSPADAKGLSDWLSRTEPDYAERQVEGILKLADTRSGKFALQSASEVMWEGKASPPQLLAHVEIEATYRARLAVIAMRSEVLDVVSEHFTMLEIDRIE